MGRSQSQTPFLILLVGFLLSFPLSQVTASHSHSDGQSRVSLLPLTLNTAGWKPTVPGTLGHASRAVVTGEFRVPCCVGLLGCECFGTAGAPGIGAGLCKGTAHPDAPDLVSPLSTAILATSPGIFSALRSARILGARSRMGHGSLFEVERKKK